MNNERYVQMLNAHGIRPTANRLLVAGCLETAGRPLSLGELERQLLSVDKSVIFRTLTLFRSHHLVHAIDDGMGGTRYELCHSHSCDADDDQHLHFVCEQCQRTYCLDALPVPCVELPRGFEVHAVNFVIKGLCPHCNNKKM